MSTRSPVGDVRCPKCGALPGYRCFTLSDHLVRHETAYHQARRDRSADRVAVTVPADRVSPFVQWVTHETTHVQWARAVLAAAVLLVVVGVIGVAIDGAATWAYLIIAGCGAAIAAIWWAEIDF